MTGVYCIDACVFLCTSHIRKARLLSFFLSVSGFSLALSSSHAVFVRAVSILHMPSHATAYKQLHSNNNTKQQPAPQKKRENEKRETREMANNHGTDYILWYFMANRWQWCSLAMIPEWWQWLRAAQSLELNDFRDESRTVFWNTHIAAVLGDMHAICT